MLLKPKSMNYWPQTRCAKAFWNQYELPPYQELLHDTAAFVEPAAGQRWLDLGCGCGQLTRMLWNKSKGALRELVGVDIELVNEQAYAKFRPAAAPKPASPAVIRFVAA